MSPDRDLDPSDGPYFEDLAVGQRFLDAPAMTLTEGRQAAHQAIVGDRLALALDATRSLAVVGGALAHPALVWDTAIGQSTVVTRHVKANLFYRGLAFLRAPLLGDTLSTVTEVVALKQNAGRPGRAPTGLAALRMTTEDQHGRPVLDFVRCAMLPLRDESVLTGHADDLDAVVGADEVDVEASVRGWDLGAFAGFSGLRGAGLVAGRRIPVVGGDVVTGAPELARLTLNVAVTHHDARAGGSRLVYGGHTIGIALAQACRALPSMVTVVAWEGCDHLGPVHEGDTLRSVLVIDEVLPSPATGGVLARLRSLVTADAAPDRSVLDWRFTALIA